MKWSWLPSMCTLGNLGFGSISLLFTIEERYDLALLMILLAAICDVMDGLLARMLHCTSDFGKQLDSLADIISFGIAPVFLILLYRLERRAVGRTCRCGRIPDLRGAAAGQIQYLGSFQGLRGHADYGSRIASVDDHTYR